MDFTNDGIPEDPLWDEVEPAEESDGLDPNAIYKRDNEEVIPDD